MSQKIIRVVHTLSRAGNAVSGYLLFLMVFYVTADVFGRYFFTSPIRGTLEVSQIMLLLITFFSIAYTQSVKGHVRMEVIFDRWSPRVKQALDIIYALIGIAIFILILQYGFNSGLADWRNELTTDQLKIPIIFAKMLLVIGSFLMVVQLIADIFRHFPTIFGSESRKDV